MRAPIGIRALAKQTGIPAHTIRAWEKRYGAVLPVRTPTNRRLYSEADVEKLTLLQRLTEQGHSIGAIAGRPTADLRLMLTAVKATKDSAVSTLQACEEAIMRLDAPQFEYLLTMHGAVHGLNRTIFEVVVPLIMRIEHDYQSGSIGIAEEHMMAAELSSFLESVPRTTPFAPDARRLLVTTPAKQYHELGALLVVALAALEGWRPIYMGTNMPAGEVASAVLQSGASAVALSIVHPESDPSVDEELRTLRTLIGSIPVWVGGRAARSYLATIEEVDFQLLGGLDSLISKLRS